VTDLIWSADDLRLIGCALRSYATVLRQSAARRRPGALAEAQTARAGRCADLAGQADELVAEATRPAGASRG
jgi:hypothetical protein